jgi:hypothetical protein
VFYPELTPCRPIENGSHGWSNLQALTPHLNLVNSLHPFWLVSCSWTIDVYSRQVSLSIFSSLPFCKPSVSVVTIFFYIVFSSFSISISYFSYIDWPVQSIHLLFSTSSEHLSKKKKNFFILLYYIIII